MSTYGPAGPVNPGQQPGAAGPYPPAPAGSAPVPPPQAAAAPDPWQDETVRYQAPAGSAPVPQSPAPQSPAPQYQQPQSPAPQYQQPQSPAPQYAAPQSPAPQYQQPQYPAPQSAPPQSPAPQYQAPAPQYQQPQAPQYAPPAQPYNSPTQPYQPVPAPQQQGGYAAPQQQQPYNNAQPAGYQPGQAQVGAPAPAYDQGYQQGGYQPEYAQQGYDQWQGEAPKKRSGAVIVLSILLVLVLAGAAVAGYIFYNKTKSGPSTPTAPPVTGTCVTVSGNPLITSAVDCGAGVAGTYVVEKVITGTADPQACTGVPGVTNNYVYTWPDSETHDFVLCLQARK